MPLIDDLMQQFGLEQNQAEGAVGVIAKVAETKLAPEHMEELGQLVPGLSGMMQAAPQPAPAGGLLGGLGALGGGIGQVAMLEGVFRKLGIEPTQFLPIAKTIMGYIQSNGSPELKSAATAFAGHFGLA